jgi:glycosyltransferase involved in cell wall biosynthesis
MSKPLVSIIIPVYNAEKHLAETIESALSQTWGNKEIIIVDDGSGDNSVPIARSFESNIVKILIQKNKGASAARNAGLKEAKGDYIQFLDGDDLLSPDKIEAQISCLNGSLTQLALCKTVHFNDGENHLKGIQENDWFYTDSDNTVDFLTKLYAGQEVMPGFGGMVTIHSWLTPRILIEKAGPWNEKLSTDDDGEFFCRVVLAADGIKCSKAGLNYYRKYNHKQSLSAKKNLAGIQSAVLAIDLKLSYLKERTKDCIIDRIFAKHYWWTGVLAYPQFKTISKQCIQKAKQLGYTGEKYVGGAGGHLLAAILGWKIARLIANLQQSLKRKWAL